MTVGSKGFVWSKGLGCELSPIKTCSACKRAELMVTEQVMLPSSYYELGAFRGIKSLARLKS